MSPFRVALAGSVLVLLSLFCLPFVSIDWVPDKLGKYLTVTFTYRGRPPLIVERDVTHLVENHLSQLEGIRHVSSVSRYGSGAVSLELDPSMDLSWMETYVASSLRQLHTALPADCSTPRLTRQGSEDPSKQPLLIYELTYEYEDSIANAWLTQSLLPAISGLVDTEKVTIYGDRQFAWFIYWDPAKLKQVSITVEDLIPLLRSYFEKQELGTLSHQGYRMAVYYQRTPSAAEDLLNISIRPGILLRDLATIQSAPDRIRSYQRINGENALFINIYAQEGVNRLETATRIQTAINRLSSTFPGGYRLSLNYDDTRYLSQELDKTWTRAAVSVIVILLMILISYRSWRYLIILFSSIWVSMAITLLCIWFWEITLHLYSIAGITISMGILVDNAIVLVAHLRKQPLRQVRLKGIISAQAAATLSTIAALLIVLVLPEAYRSDLIDFGWVVCLSLIASLIVSWWFTPAMHDLLKPSACASHISSARKRAIARWHIRYQRGLQWSIIYKRWVVLVFILAFGLPVFVLPSRWEGQAWYNHSIGSDTYQEHIRPVVNRLLGGSARLFYQNVYEKSSFRSPEKTQLYLTAQLPYGHTLQQMDAIMRQAERYLSQVTGLDKFITKVYSGQYANIVISFEEKVEKSGFPYQLKNRLIQQSLDWGGVTWNVYGVGKGFSNATGGGLPGFQVTMKGYNYEALAAHAEDFAAMLLKHRRIQTVNTNSQLNWSEEPITQYRYRPGTNSSIKDLQATYNAVRSLAPPLYPTLSLATAQGNIPVYLTSKDADQFSLHNALQPGQGITPLISLGSLRKENTLSAVHKEDRQYIRLVSFDYYGSYRFGKKYLDASILQLQQSLPPGYTVEAKEWSWNREEEQMKYSLLLGLLVILFFISSIFLENIGQAIKISLMLPISYIGLFLTFGWGGFSFDQGGYAAFLMIGGLSINAIYFILGQYRNHRSDNSLRSLSKAIGENAWPITMTVVSTCVGLLPFLIHGEQEVFWFSFAVGTIGGMLFSLIVSFYLLPVFLLSKKEIENARKRYANAAN